MRRTGARVIAWVVIVLGLTPLGSLGAEPYPESMVDSGTLRCTAAGQEKHSEVKFDSGAGRYFAAFEAVPRDKANHGQCTITTTASRSVKIKAVENVSVDVDVPTQQLVRASVVCGVDDVGKELRAQCTVSAMTEVVK